MKSVINSCRMLFFTVVLLVAAPHTALAVIYDLATDWSNITNPNGVWSLNEGSDPLPFVANWSTGQDAWADTTFPNLGHVPVWLRAEQPFIDQFGLDLLTGDIAVHGRCCSDLPGTGEANVTWTSDVAGSATISGATWWGGFPGRNVDWNIYINDALVTGGNVGDGDAFDRNTPFNFVDGFGGASVLTFNTLPGDVVTFEATRGATSPFDHFIGVSLAIDVGATAIPEPGMLALFGVGLVSLSYIRRRKACSPNCGSK